MNKTTKKHRPEEKKNSLNHCSWSMNCTWWLKTRNKCVIIGSTEKMTEGFKATLPAVHSTCVCLCHLCQTRQRDVALGWSC